MIVCQNPTPEMTEQARLDLADVPVGLENGVFIWRYRSAAEKEVRMKAVAVLHPGRSVEAAHGCICVRNPYQE